MKTWGESFAATWLANPSLVNALDGWVRARLAAHRDLGGNVHALESVAPWSVQTLAHSISAFGDATQWLWCLTAISILQELIFSAEGGGLDASGVANDADLERVVESLRALRNAVVHPAFHVSKGGNEPPMVRLIHLLEADDDPEVTELAMRLPTAWSYLAARPAAAYGLRKIDAGGRLFMAKHRLDKPRKGPT